MYIRIEPKFAAERIASVWRSPKVHYIPDQKAAGSSRGTCTIAETGGSQCETRQLHNPLSHPTVSMAARLAQWSSVHRSDHCECKADQKPPCPAQFTHQSPPPSPPQPPTPRPTPPISSTRNPYTSSNPSASPSPPDSRHIVKHTPPVAPTISTIRTFQKSVPRPLRLYEENLASSAFCERGVSVVLSMYAVQDGRQGAA
ncbi:hypothetical protein P171DRAFT_501451 [Karstenula rhodostoma CBS 690.94]|uniref:Uncharacterized protein n=1 Tax=Karstenula rhodostoma CBS 690.94 TaxID=1392251 RepID=A0A9P4P8L4_9PLEO|nr:hypothetical protein P171DRAFT_501451 [Karstenula rhodostoma CBS 690.94]